MKGIEFLATRRPLWLFWGAFWLLNWLLFLPIYLFHRQDMGFWPLSGGWEQLDLPALAETLLQRRENLDIFRLNLEFSLLVLVWLVAARARRPAYLVAVFIFYLLQMGYAIYEGFMRAYYLQAPNGYNDFSLMLSGIGYVWQSLSFPFWFYLAAPLLCLAAMALLYGLHRALFSRHVAAPAGRGAALGLGLIILLFLAAGRWGGVEMNQPAAVASSFSAKISDNLAHSQEARDRAARFSLERLSPLYEFTQYDLAYKPNIHILFVESYGSVLYKRNDYRYAYERLLPGLEERLAENGWFAASTLSDAPIWGGGSWVAYTSFLFGLPLESNSDYLYLLRQYESRPFPHMFNYLRDQGYRSYRISSNSNELRDPEWRQLKRFFGVDEWLRFDDIPYDGPLYGWGPSMPDQYALNYGLSYIKAGSDAPYVLFFISQNSHYPWYPLPEFVSDWRTLNETPPPAERPPSVTHAQLRRHYLASIEYQLELLVDLIVNQGEENDIFILIGDHQPARVARHADGRDTPVHIISRDQAFVDAFDPLGFEAGLLVTALEPTLNHAGFYARFSHILLQQYR